MNSMHFITCLRCIYMEITGIDVTMSTLASVQEVRRAHAKHISLWKQGKLGIHSNISFISTDYAQSISNNHMRLFMDEIGETIDDIIAQDQQWC